MIAGRPPLNPEVCFLAIQREPLQCAWDGAYDVIDGVVAEWCLLGARAVRQTARQEDKTMATIGPVTLTINVVVAHAEVEVSYNLSGSASDIASGQSYMEVCQLFGRDAPPEAATTTDIPVGPGFLGFVNGVVFPNALSISRTWTRTIPKSNLEEDSAIGPLDKIVARVTLTPIAPGDSRRDDPITTRQFG